MIFAQYSIEYLPQMECLKRSVTPFSTRMKHQTMRFTRVDSGTVSLVHMYVVNCEQNPSHINVRLALHSKSCCSDRK